MSKIKIGKLFKCEGEETIYRIVQSLYGENIVYRSLEYLNNNSKWQESVVDPDWYIKDKKIHYLDEGETK
jgi:hypothetical protein